MNIRCGRCQTQFAVPGPGEYACPACGARNRVAGGAPPGQAPGQMPPPGQMPAPGQMPPPSQPSPSYNRISCPECGFGFVVGDVDSAPCPNCRSEVTVTPGSSAE